MIDYDLRLIVPGPPMSWKRTNFHKGRRLTPEKQRAYQAFAKRHVAYLIPRDWDPTRRYQIEVLNYRPTDTTADWDNLGKQASDFSEGVLWRNDRQIYDGRSVKLVDRHNPRVEIFVKVLT